MTEKRESDLERSEASHDTTSDFEESASGLPKGSDWTAILVDKPDIQILSESSVDVNNILPYGVQTVRIKDNQSRRVLDSAARRRRQRKALEALEADNFQDDPHADLRMSKKAPKFEETIDTGPQVGRRKKKRRSDIFKERFRKNFAALLEEEQMTTGDLPGYQTACVPPSRFPERHFCGVCGFPSNYTCVQCGARYCSVKCLGTHQDTRCMKWTA